MSTTEEKRAEDVKPLETSEHGSAGHPHTVEVPEGVTEKTAEDTKPLALPATEGSKVEDKVEEKKEQVEEKKEDKAVEPVTSGVLGYKAPGLLKQFKFSKRYFWLGDEAVSTQDLSHYLRGTEAKTAHPVAAWSSQTGKGLLYLVKTEADKKHPQDVLLLADATDLQKESPHEFHFRLHGDKHTFKAKDDAERNGWFTAIQSAITEAQSSKEGIRKSDGYQESVKHLGKPAALAGGVAAGAAGTAAAVKHEDKKDEAKKEEPKEDAATEPAEAVPARAGSTSSSDAEKAAKKKNQSRSASRGKRSSIFGALRGKKDELETKKEVKKEEKNEEKAVKEEEKKEHKSDDKAIGEGAAAGAAVAAGGAAAATAAHEDKKDETVPEAKTETAPAAVPETKAEEKKEEAAASPKPSKRNSIFGSFYQKVKSPTTEKKESEVAPVVPPKDETSATETPAVASTETPAATTSTEPLAETKPEEKSIESGLSKPEEAAAGTAAVAAAPAAVAAAEEKKETPKEKEIAEKADKKETPKKEKESFFGSLLGKARAKSPAAGKRDVKEAEKVSAADAPAVPPKDEKPTEDARAETAALAASPAGNDTTATGTSGVAAATEDTPATVTSDANRTEGATDATDSVDAKTAEVPSATTAAENSTAETAAPKTEETPAATSAAIPDTKTATATPDNKAATPKESRRKSLFASFGSGSKKEGETGEKEPLGEKLGAIFRRPSQAIKKATEPKDSHIKKENAVPEKVEEKPEESKPSTAVTANEEPTATSEIKDATTAEDSEKPSGSIGDVVPEAVTVGQPQGSQTVSASA